MTGGLLTARGVAGRLGVTPETVLRWARRGDLPPLPLSNLAVPPETGRAGAPRGDLPAVRLSSRPLRFREVDLDACLEERATPAPRSATAPNGRRPSASLNAATVPEVLEVEE